MLADAEFRPRCLRSLSITSIPRGDLSAFNSLADVLRSALALRKITLTWDVAFAMEDCPSFEDALASVESLDVIDIRGMDLPLVRLLSRMKCRPRTLRCDLIPVWRFGLVGKPGPCEGGQPSFLSNFADSVTTLELGHLSNPIEELMPDTVWPSVRELSVTSGTFTNVRTVSCAFPNLRDLRIRNVQLADPTIPAEWPELRFLSTTDPIPLQCRVRHVQLNVDCERASASYIQRSLEMLRRASPTVLSCYASVVLFEYMAEHLRDLKVLHVDAGNVPLNLPMHSILVSLATALRAIPLLALTLDIPLSNYATCSDEATYAEMFAAAIPSLELVGIDHYEPSERPHSAMMDPAEWDVSERSWYRVPPRSADGTPVLRGLSRWTGTKIREGLVASYGCRD
ncbi:hypothetical protein EVJ58_g7283 [Rhodofomes roseus]|uniref:Uncharacterized protein n=1 Tax=Rhodofomes roseus TaxID=34475 RepID=A0A4Y9Y5X8_9APHY|nr:hypothetical protein EVJ58_g7283 [Rhodofomes roseus]